jgi:hypothetical protein
VLTPELIDYFFNERTQVFANLSDRKKALLHLIYDLPDYIKVLPPLPEQLRDLKVRRHQRFSVKCPARLQYPENSLEHNPVAVEVREVSRYGFQARSHVAIQPGIWFSAIIRLGKDEVSRLQVQAVPDSERKGEGLFGFRIGEPDLIWRKFVTALYRGQTHSDLDQATRFLN